jgi:hypothetical protein
MQMVNKKPRIKLLEEQLSREMPAAFFEKEFRKKIEQEQQRYLFSDSTKARLFRSARQLNLRWNTSKKFGGIYSFNVETITELDVLAAWSQQRGSYLSHYSALYFNGLIEQRPTDYFITCERQGKSSKHTGLLSPLAVKQAFLKPARRTQNFFEFQKSKFYLLEKRWLDSEGVTSKQFPADSKDITIRLTSIERTLIDSLISPHYSGGIATVVKAYATTPIDVQILKNLYDSLDPIYPFWQSVGFFLEKLGKSSDAIVWERAFKGRNSIPFFLEHEAKSYWKFSEKWNLYYPGGVFGEA